MLSRGAVATTTASGGDDAFERSGEKELGEEGERERVREVRGVRGVARVIQATRGKSRRWRGDVATAGCGAATQQLLLAGA